MRKELERMADLARVTKKELKKQKKRDRKAKRRLEKKHRMKDRKSKRRRRAVGSSDNEEALEGKKWDGYNKAKKFLTMKNQAIACVFYKPVDRLLYVAVLCPSLCPSFGGEKHPPLGKVARACGEVVGRGFRGRSEAKGDCHTGFR